MRKFYVTLLLLMIGHPVRPVGKRGRTPTRCHCLDTGARAPHGFGQRRLVRVFRLAQRQQLHQRLELRSRLRRLEIPKHAPKDRFKRQPEQRSARQLAAAASHGIHGRRMLPAHFQSQLIRRAKHGDGSFNVVLAQERTLEGANAGQEILARETLEYWRDRNGKPYVVISCLKRAACRPSCSTAQALAEPAR